MTSRLRIWLGVLLVLSQLPAGAQKEVVRIGPGVTAPRIVHKVEPEYSASGREAGIQGTVIFQLVVDETGRPTDISILSPLGFGLDENAQEAIERWRFVPGTKNGTPVNVLATVEVNFRFAGLGFDEKAERRRTSFNVAASGLKSDQAGVKNHAIESMQNLAREKFPPAMYVIGLWEMTGVNVNKDPADGWALIQKSAEKNYGPALYEVGKAYVNGASAPADMEKGLKLMREAATLGSEEAQFHLGNRYETGNGVERDLDRARRYFRLCATRGQGLCQYRLGRLLLLKQDRPERDYVQAIAWFQLAAERGIEEARETAGSETPKLTASQTAWVRTLKSQLVRK